MLLLRKMVSRIGGWCLSAPRAKMRDVAVHSCAPQKVVDTENPVRIENAGIRSVREIIIVSMMTPFFIALLALVASTFRTRAAQQAEIVALRHQIAVLQTKRATSSPPSAI